MYTASGVASGYMSADAAGLCLATDTAGITFRTGITGADPTDTGVERMRIDTSGIQIDARPPLQSHASQPSGGLVINGGINIEINAAPGMDEQTLARLVNAEVQRALRDAERRAQASRRSAFHDLD